MANAKTLNLTNLEALGAKRLAELLMELSTGSAAAKRQLRLALAGEAGSAEAAREVSKRLAAIAKAKTFINWRGVKPLVVDLERQHRAILDLVAPADPREAFDLLWRLVECAEPVFARSDDGSGRLAAVFRAAAGDMGPLAQAARVDQHHLAGRVLDALRHDGYGLWQGVISILAPVLGETGLAELQRQLTAWQAEPAEKPAKADRRIVAWGTAGPMFADEMETEHRLRTARYALQQVADALGDVDAYIAQVEPGSRQVPLVAADIARRLLAARRPNEAWDAIEAVPPDQREWNATEWEQARVDTLIALDRQEEAQSFRWERFKTTLDVAHLRAHLDELPDFEDFEAEQRAMQHALTYSNVHQALGFLVGWPNLEKAAVLVVERARQLNGDLYELLSQAADALDAKYPLAATLLRRAMIDFTLTKARSSRYGHAARHLAECAALAKRVDDYGTEPSHTVYEQSLRAVHGLKTAFWQEV